MKYCENCKTTVRGRRALCPLCQGPLRDAGADTGETFPSIPTVYSQFGLFFRLLILASVAASVISLAVNIMIPTKVFWAAFVVAGIGCMWLSLAFALHKWRNIPKNMIYQVVILSLLAVVWDRFTGWHGWSLDYVIPILCVTAMVSMSAIAKVMRLHFEDYLIYLLLFALFGIIPLVFFFMGLLRVAYPTLICVAMSIIALTALLVFEGRNIHLELKRRLHL